MFEEDEGRIRRGETPNDRRTQQRAPKTYHRGWSVKRNVQSKREKENVENIKDETLS